MSIEIGQLLIKSNIVQKSDDEDVTSGEDLQSLKQDLLAECRRLVLDILEQRSER